MALLHAHRRIDLPLDNETTNLIQPHNPHLTGAMTYLEEIGLLSTSSSVAKAHSGITQVQGKKSLRANIFESSTAGPTIAVLDVTAHGWRLAMSGLDAQPVLIHMDELPATSSQLVEKLTEHLHKQVQKLENQLVAIVIATPSTVTRDFVAHTMIQGFEEVDFSPLVRTFSDVTVFLENNATLAGHLEAELVRFDAPDSRVVVYLHLGDTITRSLIVNGTTISGSTGTAGEFGHVPYGDSNTPCDCGARGCWSTSTNGHALAELLHQERPHDPESYLQKAIKDSWYESQNYVPSGNSYSTDAANTTHIDAARALQEIGKRFAKGIAGLSNALAPDTIILAGLAPQLQRATSHAFDKTYNEALMNARRSAPAQIRYAQAGPDAVLRGGALYVLDHVVTPQFVLEWQDQTD